MEPRDPKNFVRLAKVLPIVNIVDRYDSVGKEIQFLGTNGRVYLYLFTSQEQSNNCATQIEARREERVFQLQRMLKPLLAKRRRTSWRSIDINSLRVIPVAPMVRLVQGSVNQWHHSLQHLPQRRYREKTRATGASQLLLLSGQVAN